MDFNITYSLNKYQCFASSLISEETRRKLIALGIDPSTVSSETQAKILIAKAEGTYKSLNIENTKTTESEELNDKNEDENKNTENAILLSFVYNAEINKVILGL